MPSRRTILAAALGAATVATAAVVAGVRWFETGIDRAAGPTDDDWREAAEMYQDWLKETNSPGLWLERS